jgi:hypothetical protein
MALAVAPASAAPQITDPVRAYWQTLTLKFPPSDGGQGITVRCVSDDRITRIIRRLTVSTGGRTYTIDGSALKAIDARNLGNMWLTRDPDADRPSITLYIPFGKALDQLMQIEITGMRRHAIVTTPL